MEDVLNGREIGKRRVAIRKVQLDDTIVRESRDVLATAAAEVIDDDDVRTNVHQ
jgi:hypothetical protein